MDWATLLNSYASIESDGRLIVIEGEAGIGKTRLAEELLADARPRGATTIAARCYEGESKLAYGPFVDGLRAALGQPNHADLLDQLPARGQPERARELAQRALSLAEDAADTRALVETHNILGILASRRGDIDAAHRHLERSLALAETLGDDSARAAALNNLALAYGCAEAPERAIVLAETAMAIYAAQGDRHREAALHNNLADLLHTAGRSEEAMAHLKRAVTIFAEIGGDAGEMQPEIWKLVEW